MNILEMKKALEENNAYIVSSDNGEKWCIGKYNGLGIDSNGNWYIVADIDYDNNIECGNVEDNYCLKLNKVIREWNNKS